MKIILFLFVLLAICSAARVHDEDDHDLLVRQRRVVRRIVRSPTYHEAEDNGDNDHSYLVKKTVVLPNMVIKRKRYCKHNQTITSLKTIKTMMIIHLRQPDKLCVCDHDKFTNIFGNVRHEAGTTVCFCGKSLLVIILSTLYNVVILLNTSLHSLELRVETNIEVCAGPLCLDQI